MTHKHEWEHLVTERGKDTAAVKHECVGCPEVMVTTLRFKGADVASVGIGTERRHYCPAPGHEAFWPCTEPDCKAGREALCAEHDNGTARETLGGVWIE